jgi:subtilisin family serine protease
MGKVGSCLVLAASLSISAAVAGCGPETADPSLVEGASGALTSAGQSYLVSFTGGSIPANAASVISAAGGTLVTRYVNVGVVLARASSTSFAATLRADARVESVGAARAVASTIAPKKAANAARHLGPVRNPKPGSDPLSFRQWDMDQIKAPQARAVSAGKPSVLVGVLDSGIDPTHPDLAGQVVASASASCVGGVANADPAVWSNDFIGHGTHVAGVIAAKKNNVGIVGVAPGVKLAAVKLASDDLNDPNFGQVYADAFVCAMDWSIGHGFDLMNASLNIDPFTGPDDDTFCSDDPERFAIIKMVRRAVLAAAAKKISLVASTGNSFLDLANLQGMTGTQNCKVIPVQLPRVIGVSAVGLTQSLAFYSNYGKRAVDLTGPGGDMLFQHPPVTDSTASASGQVLSSVPAGSLYYQIAADWNGQVEDCTSGTCATYAYIQGTSQAAPHVTGVAALAISRFGKMPPELLLALLSVKATGLPCPPSPYDPLPTGQPATCTGTSLYNNFYGAGEVDALAVSR